MQLLTFVSRCILFIMAISSLNARAFDSAVILQYHHVSDVTPASTSISVENFRQHMQYISEQHQVLPLADVITALQQNKPLPDKALVITFDDGYRDIYANGRPILEQLSLPYTVFINPERIGSSKQLSWQQIAQMQQQGASFANHTLGHIHLLQTLPGESQQAWLGRIENNILTSEKQLEEKLGYSLRYLAYPYGEYNTQVQQLVKRLGFVAFGQHSGAIYSGSDFTALPRFPAAGRFANLTKLKTKMRTLAMPVLASSITDPVVLAGQLAATMTLTLDTQLVSLRQFACYYAGAALPIKINANQVDISLPASLPLGRSRVNCTTPAQHKPGRYHWYSQPFVQPTATGKYLD